ncbi:MAG TPA: TIGR04211 family SH3 domain-containing protein [Spongiibacteraceae bacterium]|nr:TIGR04211 family SH3 domain-containing protein [Spongiibacteraceae bacterium]
MKRSLRTALCCYSLIAIPLANADEPIRYVRDWITIPLHQGQSADSAVVHSGVSSGTPLTVVQDDPGSGFTRVRTSAGVEGWIASRYLMAEPTARMQLDKVTAEVEALRKTNARLEQEQANIPQDQKLAAQQITQLRSDNTRLQQELQVFQQAPDSAAQMARDNIALKKSNGELSAQIVTAEKTISELRHAQNYTLFREGALAVFAGAILTVLIPRLKPKKRSEWV